MSSLLRSSRYLSTEHSNVILLMRYDLTGAIILLISDGVASVITIASSHKLSTPGRAQGW
jgi:hypothetical protein